LATAKVREPVIAGEADLVSMLDDKISSAIEP